MISLIRSGQGPASTESLDASRLSQLPSRPRRPLESLARRAGTRMSEVRTQKSELSFRFLAFCLPVSDRSRAFSFRHADCLSKLMDQDQDPASYDRKIAAASLVPDRRFNTRRSYPLHHVKQPNAARQSLAAFLASRRCRRDAISSCFSDPLRQPPALSTPPSCF